MLQADVSPVSSRVVEEDAVTIAAFISLPRCGEVVNHGPWIEDQPVTCCTYSQAEVGFFPCPVGEVSIKPADLVGHLTPAGHVPTWQVLYFDFLARVYMEIPQELQIAPANRSHLGGRGFRTLRPKAINHPAPHSSDILAPETLHQGAQPPRPHQAVIIYEGQELSCRMRQADIPCLGLIAGPGVGDVKINRLKIPSDRPGRLIGSAVHNNDLQGTIILRKQMLQTLPEYRRSVAGGDDNGDQGIQACLF